MTKLNVKQALRNAFEDVQGEFISGYSGYIASTLLDEFPGLVQAINETSAVAMAHIHSYLGKRSLAIMKNAGLNEAALPFRNSCDLGANAGLVIVVTDDLNGEMSENCQDSRIYADLGRTILFEPSSVKEVYEMVIEAFRVSEEYKTPALIRITNSLNDIFITEEVKRIKLPKSALRIKEKWILHPVNSREFAAKSSLRVKKLAEYVETCKFNRINGEGKKGAIYSQALSNEEINKLSNYDKVLCIGTFPIPIKKLREFCKNSEIDVIDSGEGILQQKINQALSNKDFTTLQRESKSILPMRKDYKKLFNLVKEQNPNLVTADFGSYTLAEGSPADYALFYGGAMISAVGAWIAGNRKIYSLIGDGAFTHGIFGLIEAVRKKADVNFIVIDNGGIGGKEELKIDLEKLANATGVSFVRKITINKLSKNYLDEMEKISGPSVLIVKY